VLVWQSPSAGAACSFPRHLTDWWCNFAKLIVQNSFGQNSGAPFNWRAHARETGLFQSQENCCADDCFVSQELLRRIRRKRRNRHRVVFCLQAMHSQVHEERIRCQGWLCFVIIRSVTSHIFLFTAFVYVTELPSAAARLLTFFCVVFKDNLQEQKGLRGRGPDPPQIRPTSQHHHAQGRRHAVCWSACIVSARLLFKYSHCV